MIIVSHPTGNANVRAIANTLVSQNMLQKFYTSIAAYPGNMWYKLGGIKPLADFRRRSFNEKLEPYTQLYPWVEIGRMIALKMKLTKLTSHEAGKFSVDNSYKSFDKYVASKLAAQVKLGAKAVYAYEDGALETFTEAKKLGLLCIYDLPIAYWETGRRLMLEEALRLPQWAVTLGGGISDSEAKLERKRKEMELADVVVGPGSFVLDSLPDWAKNKKQIMSPFGSPKVENRPASISKKDESKPLKVLFVGSMGQRKGLGDLFDAMKILKTKNANIQLIVLGSLQAPLSFYKNEYPDFIHELNRPHNQVLDLMRSCDVFCLPSIVEGRALVMQEAMSQGLPIIITPNTGGADLVDEGKTGFLVPIRSPQKIAEKLEWFLNNRSQIPAMALNAIALSGEYTWESYGTKVIDELSVLLN